MGVHLLPAVLVESSGAAPISFYMYMYLLCMRPVESTNANTTCRPSRSLILHTSLVKDVSERVIAIRQARSTCTGTCICIPSLHVHVLDLLALLGS